MPNHVHVLIQPIGGWTVAKSVASWKSYTGRRLARLRDAGQDQSTPNAPVWRREYFDRYIRDVRHYGNVVNYIHNNPVKAGLVRRPEEWRWSSAWPDGGEESQSPVAGPGQGPGGPPGSPTGRRRWPQPAGAVEWGIGSGGRAGLEPGTPAGMALQRGQTCDGSWRGRSGPLLYGRGAGSSTAGPRAPGWTEPKAHSAPKENASECYERDRHRGGAVFPVHFVD